MFLYHLVTYTWALRLDNFHFFADMTQNTTAYEIKCIKFIKWLVFLSFSTVLHICTILKINYRLFSTNGQSSQHFFSGVINFALFYFIQNKLFIKIFNRCKFPVVFIIYLLMVIVNRNIWIRRNFYFLEFRHRNCFIHHFTEWRKQLF